MARNQDFYSQTLIVSCKKLKLKMLMKVLVRINIDLILVIVQLSQSIM